MKKWQTTQDVYNKDSDKTVSLQNPIACLYPARACFTHFDTQILDYKTSH